MREVRTLIDFMEIVCDRPGLLDKLTKDESISPSKMNEIMKAFISLTEAMSHREAGEEALEGNMRELINSYCEYIYGYQYKKEKEKELKTSERKKTTFFYRGVSSSRYLLAPGIYRSDERHDENYYFNEINVRCPDAFRSLDNLEKLTYMQHYGCPTRLLDITSNPLVALYFACCGGKDQPGVVYIFGVSSDEVLYASSDRIQMLCKLAEFKKADQESMRYLAYSNMLKGKFPQNRNSKYANPVIEQYYHAVKRSNGAFEREIVPFDMLKPRFVQPNKGNPRILKQDGAFILSGLDKDDSESNVKIGKYLVERIEVRPEDKQRILDHLEFVGINQATLFPEVDKVADYLRRRD